MKYIPLLLILILISCDIQKEPEFSFDISEWKSDKNACNEFRQHHKKEIIENKDVFIKWPERQVTSFLGRPDRHRLSKRHQKFYVYFLETGKQCENSGTSYGEFIQLRFDAVGYVSEVEIRTDFEKLVD
jgi:hypothetical protein